MMHKNKGLEGGRNGIHRLADVLARSSGTGGSVRPSVERKIRYVCLPSSLGTRFCPRSLGEGTLDWSIERMDDEEGEVELSLHSLHCTAT